MSGRNRTLVLAGLACAGAAALLLGARRKRKTSPASGGGEGKEETLTKHDTLIEHTKKQTPAEGPTTAYPSVAPAPVASAVESKAPAFVRKPGQLKICVAGGGGFIGSHLCKRLKSEGHYVVAAGGRSNQFFKLEEFCDEFMSLDLRVLDNCKKASAGCDWVFNFAADMGGMGYIQSNHAVILYNNAMMSHNILEAARQNGVQRFFYASSACVYPESKLVFPASSPIVASKEEDAWPAQPQDAYGLEKLVSEELVMHFGRDFKMQTRIARLYNIYGPNGTWKGGREKAPAAICRKVAVAADGSDVEMWGNGKQMRSLCFIDDCVEGILRLMRSDYTKPINLGSDEMYSMNEIMMMVASFDKKNIKIRHIPGPEGVRGRNSDNQRIKEVLGWAPCIPLATGLEKTYRWIKTQIDADKASDSTATYAKSQVVVQTETALLLKKS